MFGCKKKGRERIVMIKVIEVKKRNIDKKEMRAIH